MVNPCPLVLLKFFFATVTMIFFNTHLYGVNLPMVGYFVQVKNHFVRPLNFPSYPADLARIIYLPGSSVLSTWKSFRVCPSARILFLLKKYGDWAFTACLILYIVGFLMFVFTFLLIFYLSTPSIYHVLATCQQLGYDLFHFIFFSQPFLSPTH